MLPYYQICSASNFEKDFVLSLSATVVNIHTNITDLNQKCAICRERGDGLISDHTWSYISVRISNPAFHKNKAIA